MVATLHPHIASRPENTIGHDSELLLPATLSKSVVGSPDPALEFVQLCDSLILPQNSYALKARCIPEVYSRSNNLPSSFSAATAGNQRPAMMCRGRQGLRLPILCVGLSHSPGLTCASVPGRLVESHVACSRKSSSQAAV